MFKTNNEFNLYIEQIKKAHKFETYLEAISYFIEHESDEEPEQIAKMLNKKIIEELRIEASANGLFRHHEKVITLL